MLKLNAIKGELSCKSSDSRLINKIVNWVKTIINGDIRRETSATLVILHSGIKCHEEILHSRKLKVLNKRLAIIDGELCLYL